jgi:drug/metabolite transporter (DMT)-like permease
MGKNISFPLTPISPILVCYDHACCGSKTGTARSFRSSDDYKMTMALTISPSERNSLSGVTLGAVAFALLTSVDTIFKLMATRGFPAYQILLINACFAIVPILLWTMMTGGLTRLHTARPAQHLVRGGISVMSAFAAIYAYSRLPLTDFYAIVFAGPLIVTALSSFWLGEKIGVERWLAILIGFAGILVVAGPFDAHSSVYNANVSLGRFAAFVSIFCYALSVVMIRHMRLGESNMSFSFYGYVAAFIIGGTWFALHGGQPLKASDVSCLALSGTINGISSICLMTAYHRTPVALVAPFQYTQIIWGALAGYILWAQTPTMQLILGAVIVAASGLFVIYREFRVKEDN